VQSRQPTDQRCGATSTFISSKPSKFGIALNFPSMDSLVRDFRYALRGLGRSRAFSTVAVITLALGIGATTAMFSVINAVVLRPLPYPDSDHLVQIYETDTAHGITTAPISPYNFEDWQKQQRAFQEMAAYDFDSFSYRSGNVAERMSGVMVTADFFRVLGVAPALGRDFAAGDDGPGKPHFAILSHGAWQRRFGGDREIVGRTMSINGEPYTIIGVMPASFAAFPSPTTEVWASPAYVLRNLSRGHHGMFAFARLKPGISVPQAQSQMDTIATRLAGEYPNTNASRGIRLTRLRDEIVGPAGSMMMLLAAAVGIVLLITCANLASLLLGRVMSRDREIAIRVALGANRARLVKQVLAESLVLALMGGTLGVTVAYYGVPMFLGVFSRFIPRSEAIAVDGPVLLFSASITILCGFLFGMTPAFAGSSLDLYRRAGQPFSTKATVRTAGFLLRRGLVAVEVGLALALMLAAGVLFKSMWLLYRVDPGFDPSGVMTFRIHAPAAEYPTDRQRTRLFQNIVERLSVMPGVERVGAVNDLPFSGSRTSGSFEIKNTVHSGASMVADRRIASPGYFRAMGIPLLRGRGFTEADNAEGPPVAIVNEALVRKYLESRNPFDQELIVNEKEYRIVGIIADVKHDDLTASDSPEMYLPFGQAESPDWTFVAIRSQVGTATLSDEIRRTVAEAAPDQPIYSVQTMNERLANWFAPRRFSATVLGLFTALAMLLAAIGIYGVISYYVTERTHEFGIRMALGATAGDILKMVLRQAAMLTAAAIVGGVAVSFAVNRLLASQLFGVRAADPAASSVAVLTLGLVAFSASYLPARQATKVYPAIALRDE
jgi:putative ABC transport system permease protein